MNSILSSLTLAQTAPGGAGSMITTIGTFGAVFAIFYFLIIRPQNKKQKEAQKMIAAVKKGDKVVTIGGVHGIVHAVKETTVVIKVDDDTRIEFSKSALASVTPKNDEKAEPVNEKLSEKASDKADITFEKTGSEKKSEETK